ncbi:MAG: sodium/proline symporter PutP [Candidatus Fimivivens sp.]|nr:sodium/proline symporter PutP [Candidatus Fimivivens sp.]
MSETTVILIIFFLYVLAMVGVGFFFMSKNNSIGDYILGGRGLNPWVAAMSAQASDMSGWLLTGLPGLAFLSSAGTKEAVWTAIGLAVGTYLNWLFVAKRLRSYSEVAEDALTIPEYFEKRFHDPKGFLKVICALFILFFFLIYTASMFVAGAKLFSTIFEIPYITALVIGGIVIVSYTVMGGFMAVSWTDLIQGILMFCALIIVPAMLMFGNFVDPAIAMDNVVKGFTQLSVSEDFGGIVIASALAWGLGYFGQPHILARFMGIKKASYVRPARIIAMVWVIISMAGALAVGMAGKAYYIDGLADHETIFMMLVRAMFNPVLAGVLLSAILAAIMSTADSQLLVTSSAFANDIFYQFNKDAPQKRLLWVSRITVLFVSAVALMLAANPDSSVFGLVSYAWAGFGAAFGPAILLSLFWRRMNLKAAYAGIVSGGMGTIVFKYLKELSGGHSVFAVYELLPAFILSVIVIVVVTLTTEQPSADIIAQFDIAKQRQND